MSESRPFLTERRLGRLTLVKKRRCKVGKEGSEGEKRKETATFHHEIALWSKGPLSYISLEKSL